MAGDAITKHLDGKARTRIVAGQQLAKVRRNAGQSQHARAAVEEIHQLFCRHSLLLDEMQHDAGIELAAPCTHG
jgi:hypothetical protein